ncbi:MAG: hypothetical protein Kilf2KO_17400 [Rhodospirillales bacterium]
MPSTSSRAWRVADNVVEHTVATANQMLLHLERAHLIEGDLATEVSYDDFNLVVALSYSGTLLSLPNVGVKRRAFLEEEAFTYGLADFLTGVYPDRMEASARGSAVSIRLYVST